MAINTSGIFLMTKETEGTEWTKVIDITGFPSLGGAPEKIDVTTLSDSIKKYIQGIQDMDNLEFPANYTSEAFDRVEAISGVEKPYALWLGGTKSGGIITPTGGYGRFEGNGVASVYLNGESGVNKPVTMTVCITPTDKFIKNNNKNE